MGMSFSYKNRQVATCNKEIYNEIIEIDKV